MIIIAEVGKLPEGVGTNVLEEAPCELGPDE